MQLPRLLFLLTTVTFFFSHASFAFASQQWYFPMDSYQERATIKPFGINITDAFYKGKEHLFPFNRFYGYHTGIDLETLQHEEKIDVPVYAITSGTIAYIGTLDGYGGVLLLTLENENATALYGHISVKKTPYKVGDNIKVDTAPVIISYLGDAFSNETSKERKHLHFGLYKGTHLYFRGHESLAKNLEKWYDPTRFLQSNHAQSPKKTSLPSPTLTKTSLPSSTPSHSLQKQIEDFLTHFFSFLSFKK